MVAVVVDAQRTKRTPTMSTVDDTAGEQMPLQATSSAQFQGETYQILVSMKEIEASLAELRRVHAEHGSPDDPELMTQTVRHAYVWNSVPC